MLQKLVQIGLVLGLALSSRAFASEVDQFTPRENEIQDSEPLLNHKVNSYVGQAIFDTNQKNAGVCNDKVLYKELRKYFANHLKGAIVKDMTNGGLYPVVSLEVKESIYNTWKLKNGLLLSGLFAKSGAGMGKVIRVRDHIIGVDKFEHMFGRGFSYFKSHYQSGISIEETLLTGAKWERFYFGGYPLFTGVFSYGDLVANFNGMRLWNDFLLQGPDPLGSPKGPYIECQGGRYVQVKEVILAEYIDDGFDETVNCSQLATQDGALKVISALNILKSQRGEKDYLKCEKQVDKIDALMQKYGAFSSKMINDRGIRKVDFFNVN